jgi:NADPH:quinone reductase-like Zn-dependent oxidoreductase
MKEFVQHKLPLVPGWDVSGVVEEIGPGVSQFKEGDSVYGNLDATRDGVYAEYAIAHESEIALKPRSLHHVHAAAVPSVALIACQSIVRNCEVDRCRQPQADDRSRFAIEGSASCASARSSRQSARQDGSTGNGC